MKQVSYQATQKQKQIWTVEWITNQHKSWKWMKTWRLAIKDVLSEEIKELTTIIQDNYIKLTNKIEENTNMVTDIWEQLSNYQDMLDRLKNVEEQMDQLAIQNQKLNTENLNLKSRILSLEKQALENNSTTDWGFLKDHGKMTNNVEKKLQRWYHGQFLELIMTCMKHLREATKIPIVSCKRVGKKYSVHSAQTNLSQIHKQQHK